MVALTPIAILQDRYGGTYSGGPWLAIANADKWAVGTDRVWLRVAYCLREEPSGSDTEAREFWADPPPWIAVGNSPNEALAALVAKHEGTDNWGPKWA